MTPVCARCAAPAASCRCEGRRRLAWSATFYPPILRSDFARFRCEGGATAAAPGDGDGDPHRAGPVYPPTPRP